MFTYPLDNADRSATARKTGRRAPSLIRTLLVLLVLSVGASAAQATDRNVPSTYATIQAAMNAASNGDTVIVADGIYNEHNLDFGTKNITVRSGGDDPSACIIDCQGAGRGFLIGGGQTSGTTVRGFTIRNGFTNSAFGGGLLIQSNSTATVSNCIFLGNTALAGGGLFVNNGSHATVIDCLFLGNTVIGFGSGGGLYVYKGSSADVVNCTFVGNRCRNRGGGLISDNNSNVTATNCTFSGNEASAGGALSSEYSSSLNATNCILWGDTGSEINTGFGGTATATYCDVQGSGGIPSAPDANHNFSADPLFVRNPFTNGSDDYGDLRLQYASPCRDSADPANFPTTDLLGNPRPVGSGPDMGAYEYQNVGPAFTFPTANQEMTAIEGQTLTFQATATDPDGDTLTFSGSAFNPEGVTISPSGVFSWTPDEFFGGGRFGVDISVSDGHGHTVTVLFFVTVQEVNQNPVLTQPANQTLNEGQTLSMTLAATDADLPKQTLTFSKVSGPSALTVSASGQVNWTTTEADGPGVYSVSVKVSDGAGGSDTRTFQVTVNVVNDPPTADAGSDQTVSTTGTGASVTLSGSGSDLDGDPLTYRWLEGATEIATGQNPTLTLAVGTHTLTLEVKDPAGETGTDTVTITVLLSSAQDVTGQVEVTRGGFRKNAATGRYSQVVTLKNLGTSTLTGPLSLVLDSLSSNAALYNKTGVTSATTPAGSPYINTGSLAPGASVNLTLEFTNPSNGPITYTTRVLAGPGAR